MKKSMIIKQGVAAVTLMAFFVGSGPAATLVWNFGINSSPTGAFTSGTPVNFSSGNFSIGNSLTAVNGSIAAPIANTSVSSGYAGASGNNNIGNSFRLGALNTAVTGNGPGNSTVAGSGYFEFTLTPESGYYISLSDFDFGVRSTATGAQNLSLYSSIDGFSSAIFTASVANNSAWVYSNNSFSVVNGAADAAVTFRLYGYAGAGNPGNGTITTRLDDISVTANAIAIPEPAALIMLTLGFVSLVVFRRRSQKVSA